MKLINRIKRLRQNQKTILGLFSFFVVVMIVSTYFLGVGKNSITSQADTIASDKTSDEIDYSATNLSSAAENNFENPATTDSVSVPQESNIGVSSLTPLASNQTSELPTSIQPLTSPQIQKSYIELNKLGSMSPWVLWLMYAIIPAILSWLAIYWYFRRKKVSDNEEIM